MYNFDDKPDRVSEKCRKWDLNIIRDKFGDIREDFTRHGKRRNREKRFS